jgi:hypothetical protein
MLCYLLQLSDVWLCRWWVGLCWMADTYTARPLTSCWSFNIIEDGVDDVGAGMGAEH